MARNGRHINILHFGERRISLLRVRCGKTGIEVLGFEQEHGPWSARDSSLETALRQFAAAHRLSNARVVTVLPRHEMTARILRLPSQNPAELEGIVRLNVEEYVPYTADELVIGQCVLDRTPDGHSRVLAVFAHRDVVAGHLTLLASAGIDPEAIYPSTACLASAVIAARGDLGDCCAVVDLASGGLDVVVLRAGRLEYERAMPMAHDWPPEGERADRIEALAAEVRVSLSAHQRESEYPESAYPIFLSAEQTETADLCVALGSALARDVLPARFAENLAVCNAARPVAAPLVLLGAALAVQGRAAFTVNLVPTATLQARRRARLAGSILRIAAVGAAVVFALAGLYAQAVWQRRAYIRELEERVAAHAPEAQAVKAKQGQLAVLQRRLDRRDSGLELLGHLCAAAPSPGVNITRFSYKRGEAISIEGHATSRALVTEFAQKLREMGRSEAPQFAQAQEAHSEVIRERDQDVIEYRIVINFPKNGSGRGENTDD